jgi:hypothetical protein
MSFLSLLDVNFMAAYSGLFLERTRLDAAADHEKE